MGVISFDQPHRSGSYFLYFQHTLSSKVGFGVDSVLIDRVDVVFRGLQGSELSAQVTELAELAAVGTSGA